MGKTEIKTKTVMKKTIKEMMLITSYDTQSSIFNIFTPYYSVVEVFAILGVHIHAIQHTHTWHTLVLLLLIIKPTGKSSCLSVLRLPPHSTLPF